MTTTLAPVSPTLIIMRHSRQLCVAVARRRSVIRRRPFGPLNVSAYSEIGWVSCAGLSMIAIIIGSKA